MADCSIVSFVAGVAFACVATVIALYASGVREVAFYGSDKP